MRAKLTYANVMSTLALGIAVAGGSSAVAISAKEKAPKNSVTSKSIKDGSVTAKDLAKVRVVEARSVTSRAEATCLDAEQLLGGGGATSGLNSSTPQVIRGAGFDQRWIAVGSGSGESVAYALCLSPKPTK